MSVQKLIKTQLLLLFLVFNIIGVLSVKREQKQTANITDPSYDKERDPRQFPGGYPAGFGDYGGGAGLSTFGGPIEAIIIGLLVVAGFAVVGIPFFLLFMTFFNGGGGGGLGGFGTGGLNLVPTSTTSVTGRKKRELNSLLPDVNPLIQQKLIHAFESFVANPDKITLIEKLLDSMVGRN